MPLSEKVIRSGLELTGLEYWMDAPDFPLGAHYERTQSKPSKSNP